MKRATTSSDIVMTSSYGGLYGGHSGYPTLANYIPGSILLTSQRRPPKGWERALRYIASMASVTSYYQLASAQLEWRAWRTCRQLDSGVLHLLWADSDCGVIDLAKRSISVPLVGTFHAPPRVLRSIIKYPSRLKNFNAVIVMSDTQRGYFEEAGVEAGRIHTILHGVDTRVFFPPEEHGPSVPFTLISVGSHRRNLDLLHNICKRLEGCPEIRFRLVANRAIGSQFFAYRNVEVLWGLSDNELISAYQRSSCLLLTVKEATANNGLLEGMACGLPVIAEDIGGVREYTGSEAALLITPDSCNELEQAILALARSASTRRRMGLAARLRAEQLDWHRVAQQTITVYDSCRNQH